MSDYFSGSGSDNYTPIYGSDPQEDDSRPVIESSGMFGGIGLGTALSDALQAAGLASKDPTEYSRPVYQQPRISFAPEQLMGLDPTSGQITPDIGDDRVYMGEGAKDTHVPQPHIGNPRLSEEEGGPQAVHPPKTMTVGAALNQTYLWSDDHVSEVMKRMREAGIPVKSFEDMQSVWKDLVTRASRAFTLSKGKREVTPWDVLSTVKKENVEAGVLDKDGNIVQTQVNKSVNEISDGDAWASLKSQMSQLIGRDPTEQEVRDYASKLNSIAARNPSITKTTTTTDAETGDSSTSSHTSGGYDEADQAQDMYDEITDSPEYAQYQSATTYMNALFGALGEPAGGMA